MTGIYGLTNNVFNTTGHSTAQPSADRAGSAMLRRMANASESGQTSSYRDSNTSRIISSSTSYAESIRNSRIKTKDTSNQLKKLQYNFKKISSDIIRSKTPLAAKQAASKARREVLKLKRQKASGQYDEDEIQAAIDHAKSMERIAKKKAAHLEQEELVHITDKPGTSSIADELKEHPEELGPDDEQTEEESLAADEQSGDDLHMTEADELRAQMEAVQEMMQEQIGQMSENAATELTESMDEFMQAMSDQMGELMDQMNEALDMFDMLEELKAVPKEMTESDFKLMVAKHRTDELKEIAKADKEYLKVIFNKANKGADINMNASMSAGTGAGIDFAGIPAGVSSGGFDVSV